MFTIFVTQAEYYTAQTTFPKLYIFQIVIIFFHYFEALYVLNNKKIIEKLYFFLK